MCESYASTYCNFPHRVKDGKPIQHECVIIPPKALAAEMAGNIELAIELMEAGKTHRHFGMPSLPMMRRGVKACV